MKYALEPKFRKGYRIKKVASYIISFLFSFYLLKYLSIIFGKSFYDRKLPVLLEEKGKKLKLLFSELEGLFIKTGQFLSIAGFFLPEGFKKQLEGLQDAATAQNYLEIERSLSIHFKNSPNTYFKRFDKIPIAVASIGQVHRAWLLDNTAVVVKIQHAHIEKMAEIDLKIIRKLTYWIGRLFKLEGLDFVYKQIEELILQEIDFEKEANSLISISTALADELYWSFPKVFPSLSGKKVLVMTWLEGKKITDKENFLLNKMDANLILDRLWGGFCRMIFENGFYHADPHPGNIFLDKNGQICLLDFGAVSTISPLFKNEIPGLIISFSTMDVQKLTKKLITLGFIVDSPSSELLAIKLAKAFNEFLEKDLDQLFDPQGALNSAFWKNPVSNIMLNTSLKEFSGSFRIPKDYILLGRTFSLLLGISLILRPGENPLKYLLPVFKKYLNEPGSAQWIKEAGIIGKNILSLPKLINETVQQFQSGNSSLKTPDIWKSAKLLYILGQQVALLFLSGIFFYISLNKFEAKYGINLEALCFILGTISLLTFISRWKKGEYLLKN